MEVEPLNEEDLEDGLSEQVLPKKNHEYMRERSVSPLPQSPAAGQATSGVTKRRFFLYCAALIWNSYLRSGF